MAVRVRARDIVDRYQQVIPGAAKWAASYMAAIENGVVEQQLPVHVSRQDVSAKALGGIRGATREAVVIVPEASAHRAFASYHFGFPIGVHLAIGWYVTEEGSGITSILPQMNYAGAVAAAVQQLLSKMDLFDYADLVAILSSVHQFAVMEAVYKIATEVGFDRERIGHTSSGMFGIG